MSRASSGAAAIYFAACFATVFVTHPRLKSTCDAFFGVVFVLAVMVGLLFWGMFSMDRELVLPKWLELRVGCCWDHCADVVVSDHYPPWVNHLQHTVPPLAVFVEAVLVPHPTADLTQARMHTATVSLGYQLWLVLLRQINGVRDAEHAGIH